MHIKLFLSYSHSNSSEYVREKECTKISLDDMQKTLSLLSQVTTQTINQNSLSYSYQGCLVHNHTTEKSFFLASLSFLVCSTHTQRHTLSFSLSLNSNHHSLPLCNNRWSSYPHHYQFRPLQNIGFCLFSA